MFYFIYSIWYTIEIITGPLSPELGVSRIFISTAIIKDAFDSVKVEMTVCHSICLQSSFIGTRIFSENRNIGKVLFLRFENPVWRLYKGRAKFLALLTLIRRYLGWAVLFAWHKKQAKNKNKVLFMIFIQMNDIIDGWPNRDYLGYARPLRRSFLTIHLLFIAPGRVEMSLYIEYIIGYIVDSISKQN